MPAPSDRLLAAAQALGGPGGAAAVERLSASEAGLRTALAVVSGEIPGESTRAAHEDLEAVLATHAHRRPAALLRRLRRRPDLRERFVVLSALARVAGDEATGWLVDALHARSGASRWLALGALVDRRAPAALARLPDLLRDRDSLVAFTAVQALRVHGQPEDLPAIARYAERAAIGGQEYAADAIEAISVRGGLPLPDGPRLSTATATGDLQVVDSVLSRIVAAGEELARSPTATLRSPCDGVLVGLDRDGDRLTATVRRSP